MPKICREIFCKFSLRMHQMFQNPTCFHPAAFSIRNSRELLMEVRSFLEHVRCRDPPSTPCDSHIMRLATKARRESSSRFLLLCFMCGRLLVPKPRILSYACVVFSTVVQTKIYVHSKKKKKNRNTLQAIRKHDHRHQTAELFLRIPTRNNCVRLMKN